MIQVNRKTDTESMDLNNKVIVLVIKVISLHGAKVDAVASKSTVYSCGFESHCKHWPVAQ